MSEECTHNCSTCGKNCASRDLREQPHSMSSVKKVIGVVSGKGGVGKSLVTSLLSVIMKRRGYNSAILDADITGPSIPKVFGMNKEKAMKILRAKLYEMERQKRDSARAADRKEQVGTGDRSDKIRTYNYPQNRVTDHRLNLTLYKIDQITNEGELDEIIEALIADEQARKLSESDND